MISKLKKLNSEEYDFSMNKKIYNLVIIFFLASVIGFLYEELYYLIDNGVLVKRGWLYGFYLPVYGLGAILIVLLLKRFKKRPWLFFILSMLVTGIVEYFIGALMFNIYHKTWWNYDNLFLNINGYVCLRSVLSFAVGGLILIYLVEPFICKISNKLSENKLKLISFAIIVILLVDLVCTLIFRNPI